ncbi:MAG: HD domain-containing protein [DPANN group archaeon]|nr:HD domain-containing protein [DPANN group archaeon]
MTFIKDPIHGLIKISPLQEDLISSPEMQRLGWVKQLSLTKLIFPGANHTRLEHSIGVSHIAGQMADSLELEDTEKDLVQVAGVLHDVGHGPFSHALEGLFPISHEERTQQIILGKWASNIPGAGEIPNLLESQGIDPTEVAQLVSGEHKSHYLRSIIHSEVDADRLDYTSRDAHYTGLLTRPEIDRTVMVLTRQGDEMAVEEKGIPAVETLLFYRTMLFTSIYNHHANNIASRMLEKATHAALPHLEDIENMTDDELMVALTNHGGLPKELIERIRYRELYKRAFEIKSRTTSQQELALYEKARHYSLEQIESKITNELELNEADVLASFPRGTPSAKTMDLKVFTKQGELRPIMEMSSILEALSKINPTNVLFAIYSKPELRDAISTAARQYIEEGF